MDLVESARPLSQSLLWTLQRRYFEQAGLSAWSRGTVPHYVTSNSFIAHAYAHTLLGWVRDLRAEGLDALHIVELGGGSGRFAHHFLLSFKYVLTDLHRPSLEKLAAHPSLQPFIAAGQLDFACFDAERDEAPRLLGGGALAPSPLALVANYFFDSIPQDLFHVGGGALHECLAELRLPAGDDAGALDRATLGYQRRPAEPYGDAALDSILDEYRARLSDTLMLFPCVALRCLRALGRLSDGRVLLLSADKGFAGDDELDGRPEPELAHHGAVSLMVNYHAIGRYFLAGGGAVLRPPQRPRHLQVAAFLSRAAGPETRQAFSEALERFGPDEFFSLKQLVDLRSGELSLDEALAAVRLSGWDAGVLLSCAPALAARLPEAGDPRRRDLEQLLERVWERYFSVGESGELPFCLGSLWYRLERYPEALARFERAREQGGAYPRLLFQIGMCNYRLHQRERALADMEATLALDGRFEAALAMRVKLRAELTL
jgi:hypothetical protein